METDFKTSMSEVHISDLPEEIMITIFHYLPPQDLKSVVLVCKEWRDVGEDPTLWTWAVVLIFNCREDLQKLDIRRSQMVEEIDVGFCDFVCDSRLSSSEYKCHWQQQDWIELFQVIQGLPRLNKIHGEIGDLSFMEPELLLSVFQRLEELHCLDELSHQQLELIFNAIAENRCNVKVLHLDHIGTKYSFSPQLFASAVSNVEEVTCGLAVTHEQMEALFLIIAEGGSQLRSLELDSCDTHNIEPGLFAAALNRLEEVRTGNTWVRAEQARAIIELAVKDESELKMLTLGGMWWSEFHGFAPPHLVRLAKAKFGRFYYYNSDGFTTPDGDTSSVADGSDDHQDNASGEDDKGSINSDDFDELAEEGEHGFDEEAMRLMNILNVD